MAEAAPEAKCAAADRAAAAAAKTPLGAATPPDRPARPPRPALVPPIQTPRRRASGAPGRIAMLHALAHIEFNAIDLALDMAARFAPAIAEIGLDARAFAAEWLGVASEEAGHFRLLQARLGELGAAYGDLDAHDGLWDAARRTAGDVAARLAIAPMVLEARGLDATPPMAARLRSAGDASSALIIDRIHADEIGHVALGVRWFAIICEARGQPPEAMFEALVDRYFPGGPRPPFNVGSRRKAGLQDSYYAKWNRPCETPLTQTLTRG